MLMTIYLEGKFGEQYLLRKNRKVQIDDVILFPHRNWT